MNNSMENEKKRKKGMENEKKAWRTDRKDKYTKKMNKSMENEKKRKKGKERH